jgi:hypothetical protein
LLPSQRYQQLLLQAGFKADPLQAQAVLRLDALYTSLLEPTPWYSRRKAITGIYLWGPVGTGKSLLTDLFVDCLPAKVGKTRQHYQHLVTGPRPGTGPTHPRARRGVGQQGDDRSAEPHHRLCAADNRELHHGTPLNHQRQSIGLQPRLQ